jgi:hypothetical protein
MMKQLAPCHIGLAVLLALISGACAQTAPPPSPTLTIKRNSQDCLYPQIAAGAERLWPTTSFLPRGNAIRSVPGGFMVRFC